MSPYEGISEETEVRLRALNKLRKNADIEKLYGSDEATFRKIQSLAETEIPPEVDEAVTTFLDESDIGPLDLEFPVKDALDVVFLASRVHGWKVKHNVLETQVQEWVVRIPPAGLTIGEPPIPTIYHSSCHECGEKFDEERYICPNCSAQIPN